MFSGDMNGEGKRLIHAPGEVVEEKAFAILKVDVDGGGWAGPVCADALQFAGLDGGGHDGELSGVDSDDGIGWAVVVDIDAYEDARPREAEVCGMLLWIGKGKVESSEFALRDVDSPLIQTPFDDTGRVLALEDGSGRQVRIVEGDGAD